MKTFETEKHNMPEGTTHYYHSCSGYGWVKNEPCATGRDKSFIWDGGKWVRGVVVSYAVNKIPQSKYRYEKVDCKSIDFWECAKEYQSKLGVYWKDSKGKYVIQDLEQLVQQYKTGIIYRRIEVTERELFIAEFNKTTDEHFAFDVSHVAGKLYDAGCRFVNGKG